MRKPAPDLCRLCNEPIPGPYRGHATDFPDHPYEHDADPQWRFNRSYDDLDQVAGFFDAYMVVFAEFEAAGKYPYNDSFKGRIVGIEGEHEDTAIYLLQSLRRYREMMAKVEAALADGFEHLESLDEITKFKHVVHYGRYGGKSGWDEWVDARLIPETSPHQIEISGPVRGVLPKGRRTHGHTLSGSTGRILVKR